MLTLAGLMAAALATSWLILRGISRYMDRSALHLRNATVLRADMIQGQGHVIRLWGIEVPSADRGAGLVSRRALIEMINGQDLVCHPVGRDAMGHIVAGVTINSWGRPDIGLAMITGGFARAAGDAPRHYRRAERLARSQEIGLWAEHPFEQPIQTLAPRRRAA